MKLHISYVAPVPYKTCKFGGYWSIMKGILLEEQSTLLAVSRLPFDGPSWNSTSATLWPCPTKHVSLVEIGE